MRIRVARRMYGQFVAAGKGACYGELINPVSEVRGEPPYRTVFTVNPMENFEISEVLVSEEDMEKIQQLQEVLINVNGEVLARRKDGNTPTLEYYLTKVQTRYVEHKGSLLDFRKENIQITKKGYDEQTDSGQEIGYWNMDFGGATRALVSLCIRENPNQSWHKLVKLVAEMKNCPIDEANIKLKEFRELGMLGYHNEKGVWEAWE